ncbi:MAG: chromate efflux transporter [Chloroflexi bacterium]|nr:chromate efflux transporter [Chloroflexota bacterium]
MVGHGGGLAEVGRVFARLGATSFGGPVAHVAIMRDELVRRRGWLSDEQFIELLGVSSLIPGPTSTELAMHLGYRRAGAAGFLVAGLAFILPATAIVAAFAWAYVEFGSRPEVGALLSGIGPVVVAIVAHAGYSLARTALRGLAAFAIAAAVVALAVAGAPEIGLLVGSGVVGLGIALGPGALRGTSAVVGAGGALPGADRPADLAATVAMLSTASTGLAAALSTIAPAAILLQFLKIGTVLFGSGYLLVALLRSELVEGLGWLTERQLLDAVAVGQVTPGPVFTTATFVGWLLAGPAGAAAATVGIFLPAFVAVALSIPVLTRLRGSARAQAFLGGVNAAAFALLVVVAAQLAVGTLVDPPSIGIGAVALLLLVRGVSTAPLIAAGALIGAVRLAFGVA